MLRDEFLAVVRAELQDSGTNYVWGEGQLLEFLAEGLLRLARDVPPLTELRLLVSPGQRDYVLNGVWGVARVETAAGLRIPRGVAAVQATDGAQCWEWLRLGASSVLRLRYAPLTDELRVQARGYYEFPATGDAELGVAAEDRPLLKWLVCGRALAWLGQLRAKRGETRPDLAPGYYENLYRLILRSRQTLQSFVLCND